MRPSALDLFCGAGGATSGLQLAGFHVTGVDLRPQPRYVGDAFVQADVLRLPLDLRNFDFVWASPPCQRFSVMTACRGSRDDHPDLIEPTRRLLEESGALFAIENVRAAPIRPDVVLTGCMFGLSTYRRRHFETNFFILAPPWGSPFGPESRPGAVTVAGHSGGRYRRRNGHRGEAPRNGDGAAWRAAMGIDWMTNAEIAEAIPPAYAEFIARAALAYLNASRSAA
jgi:DNA (cytosine-5)-methyltransferase 1